MHPFMVRLGKKTLLLQQNRAEHSCYFESYIIQKSVNENKLGMQTVNLAAFTSRTGLRWWKMMLLLLEREGEAHLLRVISNCFVVFPCKLSETLQVQTPAVPPGTCPAPRLVGKPKARELQLRWGESYPTPHLCGMCCGIFDAIILPENSPKAANFEVLYNSYAYYRFNLVYTATLLF